jgi:hypothetical protein
MPQYLYLSPFPSFLPYFTAFPPFPLQQLTERTISNTQIPYGKYLINVRSREEYILLWCNPMQFYDSRMLHTNISPPSSVSKNPAGNRVVGGQMSDCLRTTRCYKTLTTVRTSNSTRSHLHNKKVGSVFLRNVGNQTVWCHSPRNHNLNLHRNEKRTPQMFTELSTRRSRRNRLKNIRES